MKWKKNMHRTIRAITCNEHYTGVFWNSLRLATQCSARTFINLITNLQHRQVGLLLPVAGLLGVEKRSSSVESPNKSELGLALTGAAGNLIFLGFEENSSSSSSSFS